MDLRFSLNNHLQSTKQDLPFHLLARALRCMLNQQWRCDLHSSVVPILCMTCSRVSCGNCSGYLDRVCQLAECMECKYAIFSRDLVSANAPQGDLKRRALFESQFKSSAALQSSMRRQSTQQLYRRIIAAAARWAFVECNALAPPFPVSLLLAYVTFRFKAGQGVALATVRQDVFAIGAWHQEFNLACGRELINPATTPQVTSALAALQRAHGHKFGSRHKLPIPLADIESVLSASPSSKFEAHIVLVVAILFLGVLRANAGLALRYDPTNVLASDLIPGPYEDGFSILVIRAEKNQAAGETTRRWIPNPMPLGNNFRLRSFFLHYVQRYRLPKGQLLATPTATGWRQTSYKDLARIAKAVASNAPAETGTHSFRRAAASYLHSIGMTDAEIKDVGHWKSENMGRHYVQTQDERVQQAMRLVQLRGQSFKQQ